MKLCCLALILALTSCPAFSEDAKAPDATQSQDADDQAMYAPDYAAAAELIKALNANDRDAVVKLITFPLDREAPLKPISTPEEFLAHWDEYFDAATIKALTADKAQQYGWRGIAMMRGGIWFYEGHINVLRPEYMYAESATHMLPETAAYRKALKDARASEAAQLYPTARGYDRIDYQCNTNALHVRTQYYTKDFNDLRYFAWKLGTPLLAKPDLELHGGVYDPEGSGGNYNLIFKNGGYTYQLEIVNICGEDCNNYLTVSKDDKVLAREVCAWAEK